MPEALRETLAFLRDLRKDNSREWFERNRPRYERARASFLEAVAELIAGIGAFDDLGGVSPEECAFRIYRDVRFSKDKTPYKPNMGAVLGRGGRKSGVRSYYIHVEPEGRSFLAGGLYAPTGPELAKMREALAEDADPFKRILKAKDFARHFGGLSGESLKTAPSGYPKDHPEIDLLRRKQFLASRPLSDEEVASDGLVDLALGAYKAMKPFLVYIEGILGS
jgi:uncharacterized protein (TIGR02453 family)